jgi:hypothetical protein
MPTAEPFSAAMIGVHPSQIVATLSDTSVRMVW